MNPLDELRAKVDGIHGVDTRRALHAALDVVEAVRKWRAGHDPFDWDEILEVQDAFGAALAEATKPHTRTIFECRTCPRFIRGGTDGTFDTDPAGAWARIEGIDGPNAICPDCQKRPDALAGLVEDGCPNAKIAR